MGRWKLWFILLLPLTFYVSSKETGQLLVKTIGKELDVTPICTNETLNIVVLVGCKIGTEGNGKECCLLYLYGQDFVHECDSRFTLITKNQTVFLHLTSLTPVDGGNYTYESTNSDGTYILHHNITVEEDEDSNSSTQSQIPGALIGVTIVIVITGVIIGLIHRTKSNGGCSRSHLDYVHVKLLPLGTKMTLMTPTQAFNNQQVISTKLSEIQPATQ